MIDIDIVSAKTICLALTVASERTKLFLYPVSVLCFLSRTKEYFPLSVLPPPAKQTNSVVNKHELSSRPCVSAASTLSFILSYLMSFFYLSSNCCDRYSSSSSKGNTTNIRVYNSINEICYLYKNENEINTVTSRYEKDDLEYVHEWF